MNNIKLYSLFLLLSISFGSSAQWNLITVESNQLSYHNLFFTNDSTGYVAGRDSVQNRAVILRTTNFGNTWDTTFFSGAAAFFGIHFPSANIGYACGSGGIIAKTIDGGNIWSVISSGSSETFLSICFENNLRGYTCSAGNTPVFLTTNDGGNNWYMDSSVNGGHDIIFASNGDGFVSSGGRAYKSVDGGVTWTILMIYEPNQMLGRISIVNPNVIYMAGYTLSGSLHGVINQSNDGGSTFTSKNIQNMVALNDIFMINNTTGYAVGKATITDMRAVLKTNDGINWYPQDLNYGLNFPLLNGVHCTNDSTCYAVGLYGGIYKTTNGGGALIGVEVNEATKEKGEIIIYPNPNNGLFTIETNQNSTSAMEIKIYNLLGELVYWKTAKKEIGITKRQIDISGFSKGMYLVQVQAGDSRVSKKVVYD